MDSFTLTFPKDRHGKRMKFPSMNEYIAKCRYNVHVAASYEKQYRTMFAEQIKAQNPKKWSVPVVISFTYYLADRRMDLDNIEYARKPILDAMRDCSVIQNDSQRFVADFGKPTFLVDRENPRIVVSIEKF